MIDQFPELAPDGDAFIDARLMDQLSGIEVLCTVFAEEPSDANGEVIREAFDAHLKSVKVALDQLDDKSNRPEVIDEVLRHIEGLELRRVAFLNRIDGSEEPQYTPGSGAYPAMRAHLLGEGEGDEECDTDGVANHAYELYKHYLQHDMSQFSATCSERYEQRPDVQRKEKLKKIGWHALDVAKTGLGAGLGAFIAIAAAKKSKLL